VILRPRHLCLVLLAILALAGCNTNPTPQVISFVPSATAGAKVPTRMPTGTPDKTDTPIPSDTPLPTDSPTPATPVAEAVREIPVRLGPNSSYPLVTSIPSGKQLPIVGISEDGNWYQVTLPDGSKGWVTAASALVTAYGDIRSVPVALAPTNTPTDTQTPTSTATNTPTPTVTPTNTPSPTYTETSTPSPTPSPTDTPSAPLSSTPESPYPASIPTDDFTVDLQQLGVGTENGSLAGTLDTKSIDLTGEDNLVKWETFDGAYTDFVAVTTIAWGPGATDDYCGLRFRGNDIDEMYLLDIDRGGKLWFESKVNGEWQPTQDGDGSHIRTAADETNEMLVIATGDTFSIYINGENSGLFQEKNLQSGDVGVMGGTYSSSDQSNCTFTHSQLWQLDRAPQPGSISALATTPIEYGDTMDGSITNDAYLVLYSFTGQAGDKVNVSLMRTSGDLDALLILRDPSGNTIAANDDQEGQNTRDASLESIELPDSGVYTIAATRFQQDVGLTSGDFTLTLEQSS
jgi:uncharacterized protein YraI